MRSSHTFPNAHRPSGGVQLEPHVAWDVEEAPVVRDGRLAEGMHEATASSICGGLFVAKELLRSMSFVLPGAAVPLAPQLAEDVPQRIPHWVGVDARKPVHGDRRIEGVQLILRRAGILVGAAAAAQHLEGRGESSP